MWYAGRQKSSSHMENYPAFPLRAACCMASLIGRWLPGSECSQEPDRWIKGINGFLPHVSVTHTSPSGRMLCMLVMIHHSWPSYLRAVTSSLSPAGKGMTGGARRQTCYGTFGPRCLLLTCGSGVDVGVAKHPVERLWGYLGT